MVHKRTRALVVAGACLAIGYLLGTLNDSEIIILTDESVDTTDYAGWGSYEYDHDWRSGF